QNRGFEVLNEVARRPSLIHGRVGPGRSFEFPVRKPEFFSRAVHAGEIVDAVVRHENFELKARVVVVSLDPVDHVAAVTGPSRTDPVFVDERIATDNFCYAIHYVCVSLTAPIAADLIDELLTIAC